MSNVDACPEHGERTRSERQLRYCFSFKHHGGQPNDSQWAEDLGRDEEFAIFNEADWHQISDDVGHLYGLRRDVESNLLDLGTRGEQIAKYWENHIDQPWHGFPLWPLAEVASEKRKKQIIPKQTLKKMLDAGLLHPPECKRLEKGKHT